MKLKNNVRGTIIYKGIPVLETTSLLKNLLKVNKILLFHVDSINEN